MGSVIKHSLEFLIFYKSNATDAIDKIYKELIKSKLRQVFFR